jgi:hypothetical protein
MAVNTSAAAAAHDGRSTAGGVLWGHIPGFLQRVAEVNNGLHAAGELVQFCVRRVCVPGSGPNIGVPASCCRRLPQAPHPTCPAAGHHTHTHTTTAPQHSFAQRLLAFPDVFEQQAQPPQQQAAVTLHSCLDTTEARTAAVAGVLQQLRTTMPALGRGWRDEQYAVSSHFDRPPLLLLERAAAPFFGIRAYGVHVNGYVVVPDAGAGAGAAGEAGAVGGSGGSSGGAKAGGSGRKMLWVARRAATKQTWPGKLDHIVAGGQVGQAGVRVVRRDGCMPLSFSSLDVDRTTRLGHPRPHLYNTHTHTHTHTHSPLACAPQPTWPKSAGRRPASPHTWQQQPGPWAL